jgi:hypothetical protein
LEFGGSEKRREREIDSLIKATLNLLGLAAVIQL